AYTITHVKTGKVYVGSTKDICRRISKHKSALRLGNHKNYNLQQFYTDSPEIKIKIWITKDVEKAREIEQEILNTFHDRNMLFNIAIDAYAASRGRKMQESSKELLRAATKKQWAIPENRERVRQEAFDRWKNPEIRKKLMGKIRTEEHKEVLSNG